MVAGGIVLLVPSEAGEWQESLNPYELKFSVPHTAMRDAIRAEIASIQTNGQALQDLWQSNIPDEFETSTHVEFGEASDGSSRPCTADRFVSRH